MSHAAPRILRGLIAGATATALASFQVAPAYAAGFFTPGFPLATGSPTSGNAATLPFTGSEQIPADTLLSGGANPQSEAITMAQIGNWASGQPANWNYIIGGDATQNLFQRGTSGSSVTTTTTFGGPDRFFYWSGANTAMTVSRDSTAADLIGTTQYGFKMARTSGQTGVVQVCMGQEISSQNSYSLRGQTVELSYDAAAGANFSATSSQMTAYVIYGTASNEGAAKMAFGLNAGGGGGSGWTGQANATAAVTTITTTPTRYSAVATVPSTATEVGIALCFTPVGTAGTNDYIAFGNIQLVRAPLMASYVSTTVGYTSSVIGGQSFQRRPASEEAYLQYAYYWQYNEVTGPDVIAMCRAHSTTIAECFVNFPVTMVQTPTMTYANGFATETTAAGGTLGACSGVATASTVTSTAATSRGVMVACTATTVPAAGTAGALYDNGGSGAIKANAEFT